MWEGERVGMDRWSELGGGESGNRGGGVGWEWERVEEWGGRGEQE